MNSIFVPPRSTPILNFFLGCPAERVLMAWASFRLLTQNPSAASRRRPKAASFARHARRKSSRKTSEAPAAAGNAWPCAADFRFAPFSIHEEKRNPALREDQT